MFKVLVSVHNKICYLCDNVNSVIIIIDNACIRLIILQIFFQFVFAVVLAAFAALASALPEPRPLPAAAPLPKANPQYYYAGYYGYPYGAVAYYWKLRLDHEALLA